MLKWEWYDDINTKVVFLHLLITVNYEDDKWHGITIKRGQRISSYGKLAKETRLSVKSVRTAINHLKSTGEVANETTSQYSLFTVINYDKYQEVADQTASEGQTKGKQGASEGQQRKKANKANKAKEDIYISVQHLSMTKTEYDKLVSNYGEEKVKSKILYAENYAKLKNYKSLYLTLNNWLSSDAKKEQTQKPTDFYRRVD